MFIALLLIVLINNVNSQASTCSPFSFENGINSVVFGHVTAKGSSSGQLAIGGNAKLDQFSIGTRLTTRANWGLVVGGDLDYECGDAHANVFYMGGIRVGPRVDWNTYQVSETAPNVQLSFSDSRLYANRLQESITALQDDGGSSAGSQGGGNFAFVGSGREVEIFSVNCNEISESSSLVFSNMQRGEGTTVIIRVDGDSCSVGWNSVRGLPWREPSTHVLWSFQASSLSIEGSVPGSVLAPGADVSCIDARIEGQAYLGSVTGTLHFGPYLFSGCIPTDPCFVSVQSCPVNEIIPPCIAPNLVTDPNNPCCEIYQCASSCDEVQCDYEEIICPANYVWEVVLRGGEPGADDCCDTHACVIRDNSDVEDPRVISCPDDLTIDIPQGRSTATANWQEPQFLFVQSVSSNFQSGNSFRAGQHVVEYVAQGLRPGTQTYCMFTLTVNQESVGDTCTVGGRVYANGALVTDECNQRCMCSAGELINCVRVRQEVQTMSNEDRRLYYQNYKVTYNHADGVLRQYVDNHQQFFSRGLHNNGAFLPWHRGYILEVENRLKVQDCRVSIPYWNWRLNPRIMSAVHLGDSDHHASSNGERATRCVNTGTFGFNNGFARTNGRCLQRRISGGATATIATGIALIRRYPQPSNYDSFRNRLEHGPGLHDSVHCLVGGTMCSSAASNDPLFFNHHANIDKIWHEWQRQGDSFLNFYSGRTDRNALMPTSSWTPGQMLDLMNQPGGVKVMYLEYDDGSENMGHLNNLISEMSDDELNSLQSVGVGPAGDQWFIDMNMDQSDINTIREGERLANSDVVQEAVALTLRNALERSLQIPNLRVAIRAVSNRLAASGVTVRDYSADQLFHGLSQSFVGANLVPRFYELQDIITEDEDGNTLEILTVPVAIVCPNVLELVCTQAGLTFTSTCEATQAGYSVETQGACQPDPIPDAISSDVDGGASDAYNHGTQELATCPPTAPRAFTPCDLDRLTCFYGLECCSVSRITATCSRGAWDLTVQPWTSCSEAVGCATPPQPIDVDYIATPVLPRGTFPPTESPTRGPRPVTRAPTTSPTRAPTTAPPTLPRTPVRATPPPPPVVPTFPPITRAPRNNWQAGISRPPAPPPRVTNRVVVPRFVPRPPAPVPAPPPRSAPPPVRRTRQTTVQTTTRRTVSRTPVPRTPRPTIPSVQTSVGIVLPRTPPLIVARAVCPAPDCSGDGPSCCRSGAVIGTLPIRDSNGDVCAQSCLQCLRNGRVENTPFCCRNPSLCGDFLCPPGQERTVVRPAGADGQFPCCPEYRCEAADPCSSVVCPSLQSVNCNNAWEIGAYRNTPPLMDPLGCCRSIDCVFNRCPGGTFVCRDGSVLVRDPQNRCQFPDCPSVCPNPQQTRFCTSSGGVQVAQVRNPAPDCSWQDCPAYEPCDDVGLGNLGQLCGEFGTCVRERSVLTCECQPSYNGARCETFTEPPRRTYSPFDRSIGLTDACWAYMCNGGSCSYTRNAGANWIDLPSELKSFAGVSSNYLWFVDQNDYMVTYDPSSRTITGNRELDLVYDNLVSNNAINPPRSTYSYEDVVDGVLPPASESQWIINWGTDLTVPGPCSFMLYLTDIDLVFYTSTNLHKTAWGTRTTNEVEVIELCEDKCLLRNGRRTTCNNNGVCVRETGECICDFGFQGASCQIRR